MKTDLLCFIKAIKFFAMFLSHVRTQSYAERSLSVQQFCLSVTRR